MKIPVKTLNPIAKMFIVAVICYLAFCIGYQAGWTDYKNATIEQQNWEIFEDWLNSTWLPIID